MLSGARRPGFRGKPVNAHSLWAAWTIGANSLGGRRQPVSVAANRRGVDYIEAAVRGYGGGTGHPPWS